MSQLRASFAPATRRRRKTGRMLQEAAAYARASLRPEWRRYRNSFKASDADHDLEGDRINTCFPGKSFRPSRLRENGMANPQVVDSGRGCSSPADGARP